VATADDARDGWSETWPAAAEALAAAFWPGPLTLILPAGPRVAPEALGGTGTVALRVPDHALARETIRLSGTGVAAPSANRFGRVSPTTAQHVRDDLGEEVDVILDGGACRVGVESTIVDLTGPSARMLRPGAITAPRIEGVLRAGLSTDTADAPRAPGTLAAHYAPTLPVVLAGDAVEAATLLRPDDALIALSSALAALRPSGPAFDAGVDADAFAVCLYALLREADRCGARRIIAIPPTSDGVGAAVRDRLARAAAA
jgi:L-threonylcarbamoyladenylate synthase